MTLRYGFRGEAIQRPLHAHLPSDASRPPGAGAVTKIHLQSLLTQDKFHRESGELPEAERHANKTAAELTPGSLKRSRSYAAELAKETQETLEAIAHNRNSPLQEKARAMLKLIKQAERLLEKISQRGGSA